MYKLSPKFKLLLFSSKINDVKQVPLDLFCHTCVINACNSTLKACDTTFARRLVNYFDNELIPKMLSMEWAEIPNRAEIKRFDEEALDVIDSTVEKTAAQEDYDFIDDSEVSSNLMRAKEFYFAATNFTSYISAINNEIDMTIDTYRSHIKVLTALWTALSRYMPLINKRHTYSYDKFLKNIDLALQSSGFTSGILTPVQLIALKSNLCKFIMKQYLPSMTYKDGFFFLFISGFLIQEKEHMIQMKDLQIIIDHICDEYENKCDLRQIDVSRGDPVHQLKFSNVANIFPFMNKFFSDVFGQDYTSNFQIFSIESFANENNIILKYSPLEDPTLLLENFISMRGRNKTFTSISLTEKTLKQSRDVIKNAREKGLFVAIHYMEPSPACGAFIESLFADKNAHKEFHIVILCTDTSYIPRDFICKCTNLAYDNFPLIKIQMNQLYQHVVQTTEIRSKLAKKLTYAACLAYSLIKFSSTMSPLGIASPVLLSEDDIKAVMSYMRQQQNNDINIRNYREMINDSVFGAQFIDLNDRKKMKGNPFLCHWTRHQRRQLRVCRNIRF